MPKIDWKSAWEAAKLPLRTLVLALIPFAIAWLTEVSYEWAGAVTATLVFLDKYLHEVWKAEEEKELVRENTKVKGIVPF